MDRRLVRRPNVSRGLKILVEDEIALPTVNAPDNHQQDDGGGEGQQEDCHDNGDLNEEDDDMLHQNPTIEQFLSLKYCVEDSFLSEYFEKEKNRKSLIPYDHDLPFDRHSTASETTTKREFCVDLNEVISRNSMKASHVNDFLEVFQKHTTSLNLPIIEHNRKTSTNRDYRQIRNNIDLYAGSDNRTVVFDVCIGDCIVFHGTQDIHGLQMDCSELIVCPKCFAQRYSPCSHPNCKDKTYAQCNPFYKDPLSGKKTGHQDRTPVKTLYYRPVAAKLLTLYKVSLTKGNEGLLNYFMEEYRVTRPDTIIDINDGLEVKKQLKEMLAEFERIRLSYRERSPDTLYQCSLLLTMFYDGITLFDRKADSLMPMLMSVANCDPSNRSKLGVGMSLLALHNIQPGSGAEMYFLKNIFAVELLQLEKGIIFKFEHPEDPTQIVKVLLQARLVFAHLDTIELQKLAMIKGANSNDGCVLCDSQFRGQHRASLSKRIHVGERCRLHPHHWLRQFGEELHNGLFTEVDHAEYDFYLGGLKSQGHIQDRVAKATVFKVFSKTNKDHEEKLVPGTTTVDKGLIKRAALPGEANIPDSNCWYNNDFPLADYADNLYYPIRDTREQVFYKHMSNEKYIYFGTKAETARANFIKAKREQGVDLPKEMPDFSFHGIHGVCPLVRHLKGFGFERFCFDFMHYISNSGTYLLEFFKGERGLQDNSRLLCVAQRVFPYLQFKNLVPPWRLFNSDIIKIDSVCNSLLIPRGYKNSFNMLFPARRTGHLRASDHLTFMTAYANYLYSFTRMNSSYRSFVARFASDLCRLTQPCLLVSELKSLIKSVYETRSIQEGLFPDSEKQFINHEIIDIVNCIRNLGHVDGIQCYSGERSLSTIGRMLAKGGVHYVKGMFYRYIALENTYLYDTKIKFEFLDNTPPCAATQESKQKYSDFVLKLHGEAELITLTTVEINNLLECVVNYLQFSGIEFLCQKSSFYRLYLSYKEFKKNKLNKLKKVVQNTVADFYSWILHLHKTFSDMRRAQVSLATIIVELSDFVDVAVSFPPAVSFVDAAAATLLLGPQIHIADLETIVKEVARFPTDLAINTKVFIKGLRFNCRGQSYREAQTANKHVSNATGYNVTTHYETNALNDLDRNWWMSIDHSSWCRMDFYKAQDNKQEKVLKSTEMGQLNFCFRLNWKSDPILHGLAFGNVVIRNTSYNKHRRHYHISPIGSLNGDRKFVCLNNVCSTAIAVSVLDKNDVPLLHGSRVNNMAWARETDYIKLAPASAAPHVLYFLELHPHRVSYQYRSIEEDLDGTKHWDIV